MTWLYAVIGALAAFRLTRLVGWDEITARPRAWASGVPDRSYKQLAASIEDSIAKGVDPWSGTVRKPPLSKERYYVAKLLHCPWCVGWWISLAVALVAYWRLDVSWWFAAAYALAVSSVVGLVAKNLDP